MSYRPFRDLGLKFLAIGLAALLWLTASGEPIVERGLRVPLEFENIPEEFEVVGNPPETVDVRLRGSSGILSRLELGEIVAVLDLREARSGSRLFDLVTDHVRAPIGIDVTQVVPATIALSLERSGRRTVPVVPVVDGAPAPGFVVGEVSSEPATVEVIGPESRLRQLTEAITEVVTVADSTAAVRQEVTVGVADSALRLRSPQRVFVTVDIAPAPTLRTLVEVPVRVRNVATGLSCLVDPGVLTVRVRGDQSVVRGVGVDSVDAFVDLAGLGAGSYNLPVAVEARGAFGIDGFDPPTVQITVQ